jgi:thiol-disulfide isomerase/thioredoxin
MNIPFYRESGVVNFFSLRHLFSTLLLTAVLCLTASGAVSDNATANLANVPILQSAKGKVVLLDFWASWCAPCRKSFPWMNAVQKKYAEQGLTVIAVNVDSEQQLAAEFLRATPAQFRVEYDPHGSLATQFNVAAMPTSFLLDRNGKVVSLHQGFREAQLVAREHEIEQLLKE